MAINFSALRQFPTGLYHSSNSAVSCRMSSFQKTIITLKACPHCCLSLVCSTTCSGRSTMEQNCAKGRKNLSERWDWRESLPALDDMTRLGRLGSPYSQQAQTQWWEKPFMNSMNSTIFQLPFKKAFKKAACYAQQNRNWYVTTVWDCK